MVSLDNLEYSYHDSNMAEIGITPAEVELTIPSFVISDRAEQIAYWEHQMNLATAKLQQASGDVINYIVLKFIRFLLFIFLIFLCLANSFIFPLVNWT